MLKEPFCVEQRSIVAVLTRAGAKSVAADGNAQRLLMPNEPGFVAAIPAPSHNVTRQ